MSFSLRVLLSAVTDSALKVRALKSYYSFDPFGYITRTNMFQYPSREVGSIFEITIFPLILVMEETLEIPSILKIYHFYIFYYFTFLALCNPEGPPPSDS